MKITVSALTSLLYILGGDDVSARTNGFGINDGYGDFDFAYCSTKQSFQWHEDNAASNAFGAGTALATVVNAGCTELKDLLTSVDGNDPYYVGLKKLKRGALPYFSSDVNGVVTGPRWMRKIDGSFKYYEYGDPATCFNLNWWYTPLQKVTPLDDFNSHYISKMMASYPPLPYPCQGYDQCYGLHWRHDNSCGVYNEAGLTLDLNCNDDNKGAIYERPVSNEIQVMIQDTYAVTTTIDRSQNTGMIDICGDDPFETVYPPGNINDYTTVRLSKGQQDLYFSYLSTNHIPSTKNVVKSVLKIHYRDNYSSTDHTSQVCVGDICTTIPSAATSIEGYLEVDFTTTNSRVISIRNYQGVIEDFTITYECPNDSYLQIDSGPPICICNLGKLSSQNGDARSTIVNVGQLCDIDIGIALTAEHNKVNVEVDASLDDNDKVALYAVSAYLLGVSTRYEVHPGHGEEISADEIGSFSLNNLMPGRRYELELIPKEADGTVIPIVNELISSIVTSCSCGSDVDENDQTGTPRDLMIQQEGGFVSFDFKGNSYCEEAYAFTRQHISNGNVMEKEAFIPNFYYSPISKCDQNTVKTGMQAADNLKLSKLKVSEADSYRYCVRAVGREYMHNVNAAEPPITSSGEVCEDYRVKWESSIKGKVTLEPASGSLPVEGVTIDWKLLDSDKNVIRNDQMVTEPDGRFDIVIKAEIDTEINADLVLQLTFSKITELSDGSVIKHAFLCNQGMLDCSEEFEVHLRHLDFDEPVIVYDATSVPFTGTVIVGGTYDVRCPIQGAEVCLVDKHIQGGSTEGNSGVCGKTDSDGKYSLPATIGTTVSVEVNYFDHEFVPLYPELDTTERRRLETVSAASNNDGPTSCADIKESYSDAEDNEYFIVKEIEGKLYNLMIYCEGMDTSSPKEYVSLYKDNYSQWTAGWATPFKGENAYTSRSDESGNSGGTRTTFSKIRIDLDTMIVDIADYRWSVTTGRAEDGELPFLKDDTITKMPFGTAANCDPDTLNGIGKINLVGTPFTITEDFTVKGYLASGSATKSLDNQVVDMRVKGGCALVYPGTATSNPIKNIIACSDINCGDDDLSDLSTHLVLTIDTNKADLLTEAPSQPPSVSSSPTVAPTSIYDIGIYIEPGGYYENNDFEDITTVDVVVEVAGGMCNKLLGTSQIEFQLADSSCGWSSVRHQASVDGLHNVPAQKLDVSIQKILDPDNQGEPKAIFASFASGTGESPNSLDLRELNEEEKGGVSEELSQTQSQVEESAVSNEEQDLLESEENTEIKLDLRKTRFQYDGELKAVLSMGYYDEIGECSFTTTGTCSSLHVIQSATIVNVLLLLKYEIEANKIYCDIVGDDVSASLLNHLAPTEEEIANGDTTWLEYDNMAKDVKSALHLCNDECDVTVKHDVSDVDGAKSNARIEYNLMTGPPNIKGDFVRDIELTISKGTDVLLNHIGCVGITGDFPLSQHLSVGLPSHRPLLVIRDPPGGLSYASYENIRTSFSIDKQTTSKYRTFQKQLAVNAEAHYQQSFCAGGGVGVIVINCMKALSVKANGYVSAERDDHVLLDLEEIKQEGDFETTWSFQTSSDPFRKGRLADTFLVPNLSVKYMEVTTIGWDASLCALTTSDYMKFNLESQMNTPAISFLTVDHIENEMMPVMQGMIDQTQKELENAPDKYELENKKFKLEEAMKNWRESLAQYDQTNQDAADGKLTQDHSVNDWSSWVEGRHNTEGMLPEHHFSSLIPYSLYQDAEKVSGSHSSSNNEILETNEIQFQGGGGEITFSMMYHSMTEHLGKLGGEKSNQVVHDEIGGGFSVGINFFGIGGTVDGDGVMGWENEVSHKGGTSSGTSTRVSFTLGDDNGGDAFNVGVYTDPKYGTFVFDTTGGVSSCPHEKGTEAAAIPFIKQINGPDVSVLPDDLMVFEILIRNDGIVDFPFEIFIDNESNKQMLTPMLNGASLATPQSYNNLPSSDTGTVVTLTVARGPVSYDYDPLIIGLRVGNCGGHSATATAEISNKNGRISFVEPCPKIFWGGDMRVDQGFKYSKNDSENESDSLLISVFNPQYATKGKFVSMEAEIVFEYRRLGALFWNEYDIGFVEDENGYANGYWDASDGEYELRISSKCNVEGVHTSFNKFSDDVITGIIDRVSPKLYTSPSPSTHVWPDGEISFMFTEPIRCTGYKLVVTVEDTYDIEVSDGNPSDEINILCQNKEIKFAFDNSIDYEEKLMGKRVLVVLTDVKDIVGNMANMITHEVAFADLNLHEATATFEFTNSDPDCGGKSDAQLHEDLASKILEILGEDVTSRMHAEGLVCNNGTVTGQVTILPYTGDTDDISRRLADNLPSSNLHKNSDSHRLARALQEKSERNNSIDIRNFLLVLGKTDNLKKNEAGAIESSSTTDIWKGIHSMGESINERMSAQQQKMQDQINLQQQKMQDRMNLQQQQMQNQIMNSMNEQQNRMFQQQLLMIILLIVGMFYLTWYNKSTGESSSLQNSGINSCSIKYDNI